VHDSPAIAGSSLGAARMVNCCAMWYILFVLELEAAISPSVRGAVMSVSASKILIEWESYRRGFLCRGVLSYG
jgi:predicted transcriptional regulator